MWSLALDISHIMYSMNRFPVSSCGINDKISGNWFIVPHIHVPCAASPTRRPVGRYGGQDVGFPIGGFASLHHFTVHSQEVSMPPNRWIRSGLTRRCPRKHSSAPSSIVLKHPPSISIPSIGVGNPSILARGGGGHRSVCICE